MKARLTIIGIIISTLCYGQHHNVESTTTWGIKPLFNHAFADSIFSGKEVRVSLFTIPGGTTDTLNHVHDCHLIGYVLEGSLVTKMKNKQPKYLKPGDVFYEFPNEVHESLTNLNKDKEARVLLYYLFKSGATLYKKISNE